MFKRFSIITFFVLLGTMVGSKPLQAMYIPDLWEDIWEENEQQQRDETVEQASRLNTLFDADGFLIPEGFIETLIGMDENYDLMSDEEKRESVHTLRAFLHETAGLRRDAVKKILRSLCNKTNTKFKDLGSEQKDAYSIQELQDLFEKSTNYKTRFQLIIKQTQENIVAHPFAAGMLSFSVSILKIEAGGKLAVSMGMDSVNGDLLLPPMILAYILSLTPISFVSNLNKHEFFNGTIVIAGLMIISDLILILI